MDAVISQPVQCDAPGWATFSSETWRSFSCKTCEAEQGLGETVAKL